MKDLARSIELYDNRYMQQIKILSKKLAAFFIDLFIISLVLDVILSILIVFDKSGVISNAFTSHTGRMMTYTLSQVQIELYFTFIFIAALYQYIAVLIGSRSIGMLAMGLIYTASDTNGNSAPLYQAQKFLRGFICTFLTYFFICIPALANPFDAYQRSLNDALSHTVIIEKSTNRYIESIALGIIFLSILFFVIAFKGI